MAKKKTKKPAKTAPVIENALPQNILLIGERVEENKNIYISQPVYKEIHKFTKNKTTNESGGMLVGRVIEEFGKTNIIINGFVEAKHCEATPTTLKFTHETWEHVHKEREKKFPGQKIVGWIHTHPDFGIFLSEYDKFIQENFFREDYQIAYVVDPIQQIEGFYFWINGNIEKCSGFYKFDKMGAKIDEAEEAAEEREEGKTSPGTGVRIVTAILAVCVAFLMFINISQNKELKKLQNQQNAIVASANEAIMALKTELANLEQEFLGLQEQTEQTSDETEEVGDETEEVGDETEETQETTDETTGGE